jgi:uncharacterized protein
MQTVSFKPSFPAGTNTDFESISLDREDQNLTTRQHPGWHNLKYLAAGILFGIILVKGEIISWFRIQEMFRLQSLFMYEIIGSAVAVGMLSIWLIKKWKLHSVYGEPIFFYSRRFQKGQVLGGLLFGCGWAFTGACPGPLYAQIGAGSTVVLVTLASAIAGTWFYGLIRERLPH